MSFNEIPDWLKQPLLNVKLAASLAEMPGDQGRDLRREADRQLVHAIELRLELAREAGRKEAR